MPTKAKSHKPRVPRPRETRPSAHRRGYGRRWREYALGFLMRNPVCAECGRKALHVDHLRAVSGPDDPEFWLEENHRSLCPSCHSRKTVREDGGLGRRPQGEGKSSVP